MRFNIPSANGSSDSPNTVPSVSPAPIPVRVNDVLHPASDAHRHGHAGLSQDTPQHYPEHDEESVWEHTKEFFRENQDVANTFVAGGIAGAASRTVVSPLERLKIILQVQSSQPGGQGQAYGGVYASLKRMWKNEGFAGFMKGNGINVIRVGGLTFLADVRSCRTRRSSSPRTQCSSSSCGTGAGRRACPHRCG